MQSELAQAAALLAAEFPDAPRSMLESALRENDLDIPSARRRLLEMLEQEKRGTSGAYSSSRVRPGMLDQPENGRWASPNIQPAHTALPPPAAAASPAESHVLAPRLLPPTILLYVLLQASAPVESPTSPSSSSWFTTAGWNQVGSSGVATRSALMPPSWWPLAPCSAVLKPAPRCQLSPVSSHVCCELSAVSSLGCVVLYRACGTWAWSNWGRSCRCWGSR